MPPYIIGGTSASGPINQLMPFEQSDRNPSGIGHGLCTVDDQLHRPGHIELSSADQPFDFDDGGEPLLVHLTLLHRECVGQKLLESAAIETGINKHIRVLRLDAWTCRMGWRSRVGPNQARCRQTAVS